MRKISKIIVHCTATPEGQDVSVESIDRYHRSLGWAGIGYHFVIGLDGTVHKGRPVEKVGAHCKGHNTESIGIAYVGGHAPDGKTPKDTRTPAQRKALRQLVTECLAEFPGATVHAHNEFANKACPCFKICDL